MFFSLHKTFKALNGPLCADVPLKNYSLTQWKKWDAQLYIIISN